MKVQVFAILKDHFPESFEIEATDVASIVDLKNKLMTMNASAATILNSCRFAVNEEFVSPTYRLKGDEYIYIIPPSSGG